MKISVFILFIFSLQLSARTNAQEKITLKAKGASLSSIFVELQKQTGISFFLSEETIKGSKPIDIDVKNASLRQVLDICFKKQPFTYYLDQNTITIIPKKKERLNDVSVNPGDTLIDITGRVIDKNGNPLEGATIQVSGTNKSTVSDYKGEFFMKNINARAVVSISNIGYEETSLNLNKRTSLIVTLLTRVATMDEVQVIGYGLITKRFNTGNVTSVKAKDIQKQPVNNPLLALQGRVPGMEIIQGTGLPGSGVAIRIRGRNSINNGNNPLFIIDGVPYTADKLPDLSSGILGYSNETAGNPFSYINPADIESIEVLKDADATAIYGTRGANGVILITTKKGTAGQMRFDVNMQSGIGKVAHKMKVLDRRQYLDMRYEALRNDGATPNPNVDYDLTLWDTTRSTDWQKELIGGTARYHDIQTSLSGGNIQTQYRIGAGFHKETTVFLGDFNDQKTSVQFSINSTSPNKKLKVSLSGVFTTDNNRLSGYDFTEQAVYLPPVAPALYNKDGSINWASNTTGVTSWPYIHPAAMKLITYQSKNTNLVSNATIGYELMKGLEIKSSMGYTQMQTDDVILNPLSAIDPSRRQTTERRSSFADNRIQSWIIEPQIIYTGAIAGKKLSVLFGSTIQQNRSMGETFNASGFSSDLAIADIRAANTVRVASSINSIYKYNAVFGRINYNLWDRYLFNITARRDGTSRFGPASRFHNFGAIGVGWIFSKERFIEKAIHFLSFGKLRGSYGTTGSDQVGDYTFMDLYTPISYVLPYQGITGTSPNRIYTPDLAWEQTKKLEVGLELGFLNDQVFTSISYYRNRSSNQLMNYTLPSITGFTSVTKNLNALVENSGFEMEIRTVNLNRNKFRWETSINFSINRNKVVSASKGVSAIYQRMVGHPINTTFVYRYLGVDILTGLYQVADENGSPTSKPNPESDAIIALDLTPNYFGGVQNNISYKGLQLDFLLQFVKRLNGILNDFNYIPGYFGSLSGSNQPTGVLERWQAPGEVKNIQRFSQNFSTMEARNNVLNSDRIYGDVSFIRLKNASLSWNLPNSWKKKVCLNNARIYMQGQNLFTLTSYKGLDPENFGSSPRLPPLRVITVGIHVTF